MAVEDISVVVAVAAVKTQRNNIILSQLLKFFFILINEHSSYYETYYTRIILRTRCASASIFESYTARNASRRKKKIFPL